ncbi:MAG: AAA family ATPase [Acholeplasmatales bacterium]|nr:AAA family ATPase [Acholeplasmatales bacterium]
MNVIGRNDEIKELNRLYESSQSELVAVYGRRRVGKTFLINEVFKGKYSFKHTGLSPIEIKEYKEEKRKSKGKTATEIQLEHFYHSLKLYGMKENKVPKDWLEAFFMLEMMLQNKYDGSKQVVFIDELPWLDTQKSLFITGFEAFWNGWANGRNIIVIICGSAISWMTNELINNHGGLYGRVTYEIKLAPFKLKECELFLKNKNVNLSRYDITQAYMALGGIPYYLNYIESRYSLPQNIDMLFFSNTAKLKDEFLRLFTSAFDNPELTIKVVRALSSKKIGLTRKELTEKNNIGNGGNLSKTLNSLICSDFVIKYVPLGKSRKDPYYKLIDPFCLFYLRFIENKNSFNEEVFQDNIESQQIVVWRSLAYENVAFNHINQIKDALGIRSVSSVESTFYESTENDSAQIDMIIERKDNIVNMCEIKFYSDLYVGSKNSHFDLVRKNKVLSEFIKKKEIIHNTLITTYGLKDNEYRFDYTNVITLDDLFE